MNLDEINPKLYLKLQPFEEIFSFEHLVVVFAKKMISVEIELL